MSSQPQLSSRTCSGIDFAKNQKENLYGSYRLRLLDDNFEKPAAFYYYNEKLQAVAF